MENETKLPFIPTSAGSVLLCTEVTIGSQTWTFATTWIKVDSKSGADEYETTIAEPGTTASKSVRRCLTQARAYEVHRTLVHDLVETARGKATVIEDPPGGFKRRTQVRSDNPQGTAMEGRNPRSGADRNTTAPRQASERRTAQMPKQEPGPKS